jgi:hypothetical protein
LSALTVGVASDGEPTTLADEVLSAADCMSELIRSTVEGGLNTVNVNAFDVPPPPPSVSVNTVTEIIAGVPTSAVEIAALSPVGLVNVVVRGIPFHWTIEHGTRLPPLALVASTPSMNPADPATTLDGKSVVMTGTGSGVVDGATEKGEDREAKDGIVALDTVMLTGDAGDVGKAVSVAGIAAVSCVALT